MVKEKNKGSLRLRFTFTGAGVIYSTMTVQCTVQ